MWQKQNDGDILDCVLVKTALMGIEQCSAIENFRHPEDQNICSQSGVTGGR